MLKTLTCSSLFILLNSCGLPSITSVQLEPSRPEISGYYDGTNIVINISGYYPIAQFPDFNGFNIYFGSDNEETNILKRVIYSSDHAQLPSFFSTNLVGTIDEPLRLATGFTFRLTSASDEKDLADELVPNIDKEISEEIETHNRFYFIARPVSAYKEYDSSERLRIYVPELNHTHSVTLTNGASATLSSPIETNDEAQFNNEILFPVTLRRDINSGTFSIGPTDTNSITRVKVTAPQSIENGCYRSFDISTNRETFLPSEFPLSERSTYVFISERDNASNYQYRIYVADINITSGTVIFCTAYERY